MQGRRVLLIDADSETRAALRRVYRDGDVAEAADGAEALRAVYRHRPDLVVLDVELPGVPGWEILARVRDLSDVPIMVVTAVDAQAEKIRALRSGADDYVVKPFDPEELAARSQALLRRYEPAEDRTVYRDELVEVDSLAAEARATGKPLELTPLELRLLTAFVQNPDRVLSADELLAMVWRDESAPPQRVKLTVGYLREKFRRHSLEAPIQTVRGFGYRYRPPALGSLDTHLARFEHLFAPLDEIRGPNGQRFFPSTAARDELATALGVALD